MILSCAIVAWPRAAYAIMQIIINSHNAHRHIANCFSLRQERKIQRKDKCVLRGATRSRIEVWIQFELIKMHQFFSRERFANKPIIFPTHGGTTAAPLCSTWRDAFRVSYSIYMEKHAKHSTCARALDRMHRNIPLILSFKSIERQMRLHTLSWHRASCATADERTSHICTYWVVVATDAFAHARTNHANATVI